MAEHLYDSAGSFIAFRRSDDDRYVFNRAGKWIGWLPYDDLDVHDPRGAYLGTIVGDRLLRLSNRPGRGLSGLPSLPGLPGLPGLPRLSRPGHAPARSPGYPQPSVLALPIPLR